MELVKIKNNTYYIKNATNIGIYKIDNDVYLIDTGNDKDAGKKILKIVLNEGWNVKGIINTHSHADHIGGNKVIQDRTGCLIYASNIESCFIRNPILEPTVLYGAYPIKELQNKFLLAKESSVSNLTTIMGLEYIDLPGHSYDMIGVKTIDGVYFLADSLISKDTILKYHLFFLYDVRKYLETLQYLKTLKGTFVLSHAEITDDISELIKLNEDKIKEISEVIYNLCDNSTFESIIKGVFDKYNIVINTNQYFLLSSTIKAYLTYLHEENKITYEFKDNMMYYEKVSH